MKQRYIYFMANKNNTVIYIGVTSNLLERVQQLDIPEQADPPQRLASALL